MTEELLDDSMLTESQLQMLKAMANSRLGNYAGIPGLSSSLLGGPEHGRVRLFDCSRAHEESIVPHSHRFDVLCLVLRGAVENHLWHLSPVGDLFTATEVRYTGKPGHLERGTAHPAARYSRMSTRYVHGDFYSMEASEIHSITFSRDALVLFFEGPEQTSETLILEPFVDGVTVPTFQVQPWMYAPTP